ncbi:MAG: acetyl-CoA carboxylase carboxyl transferase subunit alpha [Clostridia bacterium]|nr:acetyl-CoA carboxylase carboxyl transferase subunit alpha [Clostridia bacterium]
MNAYEKIKCTRKAGRATAKDYIDSIFDSFIEFHGDRRLGDDPAIVGGVAFLDKAPVTVIGIEKGHELNERIRRNFGCVSPEGYRKALRLMKEAEKFGRPVVCFVDTQGASCGKGAEEHGAGQAIADNLYEMMTLRTPVITVMVGEGSSGGALALAVADEIWMLENAYFTVVSPEACASILYKDSSRADEAAEHLKLSAQDLTEIDIVENLIKEPQDFTDEKECSAFMDSMKKQLVKKLKKLSAENTEQLLENRYEKYRKIGRCAEEGACRASSKTKKHGLFRR